MSSTIVPTTTGVTIHMQPRAPQMSSGTSTTYTTSSLGTVSSSTKMSMSTSSTSTKTTKITKTTSTSYSSSTSSTTKTTSGGKSTYKTITTKSSSSSYSDNLANMFGIDANSEMEKLQKMVEEQMGRMKTDMFQLKPITMGSSSPESSLVRLDKSSIMDYIDQSDKDLLRFNFDMGSYSSESVNVRTVGNQIEVHAQRKTKTADGETSEEFSRTYEMPTDAAITPDKVTSSLFKEGVLTVQLPVSEAVKEA